MVLLWGKKGPIPAEKPVHCQQPTTYSLITTLTHLLTVKGRQEHQVPYVQSYKKTVVPNANLSFQFLSSQISFQQKKNPKPVALRHRAHFLSS